jgi:hypothetical protein
MKLKNNRMKNIVLILVLVVITSCKQSLSNKEVEIYTIKGTEIAQATFKSLSGNLMEQMKQGGPAQAVPFCNLNAVPISEELSKQYDVVIKRTSNKLRSCENEPTDRELDIILQYESMVSKDESMKPIVEIDELGKKHFYAPIKMQSNCLVCHGKLNETMTVKTDSIIKSLYQFDIATGYSEGDLRGIWSITFNK